MTPKKIGAIINNGDGAVPSSIFLASNEWLHSIYPAKVIAMQKLVAFQFISRKSPETFDFNPFQTSNDAIWKI